VEISATASGMLSPDRKHPGAIPPMYFVTSKQRTGYVFLMAVRRDVTGKQHYLVTLGKQSGD
jgi:hypothetical protein